MSIETNYNINFVAALALREKQIQQNYRPIIAVHKWFARRPGTLFRGLILSEFGDRPVEDLFYQFNDFPGRKVADPFMGGGSPLLEANRVGCDVLGLDINPMATWVVREEIEHLDLAAYRQAADDLINNLSEEVGALYRTRCVYTGAEAHAKYFLWVKQGCCEACNREYDLFQGYLLAEDVRHPKNVVVCHSCGELNEVSDVQKLGKCSECKVELRLKGPVFRNKAACPHCNHVNKAPFRKDGPPQHRLFAIEYYCSEAKDRPGRLFKRPDAEDLARVKKAETCWQATSSRYVPEDEISSGDETDRLHRWGYDRWNQLFNARQLLGLEMSARQISRVNDDRVRRALATNLSDLLRYQNMVCRYDLMALKSLDVFSVHGFPVGYVQCESNILGIRNGNGTPVGSGGWVNITDKYAKAKRYCDDPFEVFIERGKKTVVPIKGEWIGEERPGSRPRQVEIRCASSTELELVPGSLDAVLTDPPYFGMVQYGELMEFCYVWLRKLMGADFAGMERDSARHHLELTGNNTAERDLEHFTEGLAEVYSRSAKALKPGAPLAFTYHHNKIEAYGAVGVAVLDAGLICSASLPCPAEMGGSIHIHGTGSSIVDTIFVCRSSGETPRAWLFEDAAGLARIISHELAELRAAGMKPTDGDIRCIVYGHLTRMAIWKLRRDWDPARPTADKLSTFQTRMTSLATLESVRQLLAGEPVRIARSGDFFNEHPRLDTCDAVAF